ncbi:MAG: hypothetical protein BWY35_00914 [Firmicutes bacterium ADurb.Bin248]|nr:MAG: hypothetical protein BWY35_00914 [Firmicutes bacterium ADurb.Bin248]
MTNETILEKKGVYAPWEDDLPSTCRHCDGSKYIISILYEAKKSRERIAELATLTPRLASLSLYSDEGRKVRARVEYLERRIRELELEKIRNKRFYFIATAEGPSDTYAKDFKRVVEPVQGWLDCFEGMKFETMICSFDTGTTAVEQTEVWLEAEEAGAQI